MDRSKLSNLLEATDRRTNESIHSKLKSGSVLQVASGIIKEIDVSTNTYFVKILGDISETDLFKYKNPFGLSFSIGDKVWVVCLYEQKDQGFLFINLSETN